MKNQNFLVSLLFVSLLSLPLFCGAAAIDPQITTALNNVFGLATSIVGIVCGLMILIGGFIMLTSSGSPDKVSQGKQIIIWAAIGLVVVLLAKAIGTTFQSIVQ